MVQNKDTRIPPQYQTVMAYLIVKDATGFISFMQTVFDAEETYKTMRDTAIIAHAEIMIGGSTIMLADATADFPSRTGGFFLYVDDADLRYQRALDAGATSIIPPVDQPYGRSGGVIDAFGNTWWITTIQ